MIWIDMDDTVCGFLDTISPQKKTPQSSVVDATGVVDVVGVVAVGVVDAVVVGRVLMASRSSSA